jgi:hypothetical protein
MIPAVLGPMRRIWTAASPMLALRAIETPQTNCGPTEINRPLRHPNPRQNCPCMPPSRTLRAAPERGGLKAILDRGCARRCGDLQARTEKRRQPNIEHGCRSDRPSGVELLGPISDHRCLQGLGLGVPSLQLKERTPLLHLRKTRSCFRRGYH